LTNNESLANAIIAKDDKEYISRAIQEYFKKDKYNFNKKHFYIMTDYSIGTTGYITEIMSLDFCGGPTLYIGDLLEFGVMIESIKHCNELGIYVKLKEI
jgi:hypothetical protein